MPVEHLSGTSPAASEGSLARAVGYRAPEKAAARSAASVRVCLLTGGDDRHYALGMASALVAQGITTDFIGSDKLDAPALHRSSLLTFLNLRGDQSEDALLRRKLVRIVAYYARLAKYATRSRARIFHILWNNKFEHFDRTLLMLYYRLFGKRIILTAHNVNMRKRDGRDTWLNRLSLRIQYRLCDHILVHTAAMKHELVTDFGVPWSRVGVIPFGINNACRTTALDRGEARERVGLGPSEKVLLFFGQIAPYKGLEYLIAAFSEIGKLEASYRLVIAGKVKKGYADYWNKIQSKIAASGMQSQITKRIDHIPDEEVELYFKAADVVVIPYVEIFQSGVPFLSYSFGLPVVATDVGSLRDDIIEGETGFLCRAKDPADLVRAIRTYFASDVYQNLEVRRSEIREFANERNSWTRVGEILDGIYRRVLSD